ncbi:MAG: hypothetical protein IKE43_13380 [Coriobacteriales bacterium]|nr:hypothetical protein [Coriobacteriales bacterium]
MGFDLGESVSGLVVFVQGLLSFFSPCVLPIVPLYAAYLAGSAGNASTALEDNNAQSSDAALQPKKSRRGVLLINTLFFVLGIAATFFILGAGATALGQLFGEYHDVLTKVGGVIIILFGIVQFFAYGKTQFFGKEFRLPLRLDKFTMNPLTAFILGFFFSFSWTPCVGPVLTSVLMMAGAASTAGTGFALIGVYTLGFAIPFLAIGLLADSALGFFKKHRAVAGVSVKIGAVLLIIMGVLMLTGWMNTFSRSMASLAV